MFSTADTRKMYELARWCWNKRFFTLPVSSTLAKPLLDTIFKTSTITDFALYSAHDYTILALLASLGIKEYPPTVLSFSSYLVIYIDTEENNEDKRVKKIVLNPQPLDTTGTVTTGQELVLYDIL
mmetsp:Transcript_8696/g.9924  ORF Transcript_8696/g.9924 Transcript_8696/m.9924 type:complete len:125 (+) Transcript_8696:456-830(+)